MIIELHLPQNPISMSYDTHLYKIRTWKNPRVLHALLNPGIAFHELVLGRRLPVVMLVDKDDTKPLTERNYVPCPHCHTIHPGKKWTRKNKTDTKNWFGLYCDQCGKTIPCFWNLTSIGILFITYPFWVFFKDRLKEKWRAEQQRRFSSSLDR